MQKISLEYMYCLPTRVTRSWALRPTSANFCFWTATESVKLGKLAVSEANDTSPSLRPVGTRYVNPPT